jgi:DNA/RNA-binding domain of Phe-tRNA-synthetase-like protein
MFELQIDAHPQLEARSFVTTFPAPLEQTPSPDFLATLLSLEATAPVSSSDPLRAAVRDLLRYGGFKPTGRSKPASEYLIKAANEKMLSSINAAVDACNVVSLHSGLPISVVDLDRARAPFRVGIAPEGASYVFNASGQTIDIAGLLCLFDAEGPCANAVKDAQRTKTSPSTQRTLSVIWGTKQFVAQCDAAERWYHELVKSFGAEVELCCGVR